MRISDWSSDVCSSDLPARRRRSRRTAGRPPQIEQEVARPLVAQRGQIAGLGGLRRALPMAMGPPPVLRAAAEVPGKAAEAACCHLPWLSPRTSERERARSGAYGAAWPNHGSRLALPAVGWSG